MQRLNLLQVSQEEYAGGDDANEQQADQGSSIDDVRAEDVRRNNFDSIDDDQNYFEFNKSNQSNSPERRAHQSSGHASKGRIGTFESEKAKFDTEEMSEHDLGFESEEEEINQVEGALHGSDGEEQHPEDEDGGEEEALSDHDDDKDDEDDLAEAQGSEQQE